MHLRYHTGIIVNIKLPKQVTYEQKVFAVLNVHNKSMNILATVAGWGSILKPTKLSSSFNSHSIKSLITQYVL